MRNRTRNVDVTLRSVSRRFKTGNDSNRGDSRCSPDNADRIVRAYNSAEYGRSMIARKPVHDVTVIAVTQPRTLSDQIFVIEIPIFFQIHESDTGAFAVRLCPCPARADPDGRRIEVILIDGIRVVGVDYCWVKSNSLQVCVVYFRMHLDFFK